MNSRPKVSAVTLRTSRLVMTMKDAMRKRPRSLASLLSPLPFVDTSVWADMYVVVVHDNLLLRFRDKCKGHDDGVAKVGAASDALPDVVLRLHLDLRTRGDTPVGGGEIPH